MTGRVAAVNVVHQVLPDPGGTPGRTAIDKRPQQGRVGVGPLGLTGDLQCDTEHHGGRDQAVYAYAAEDAAWWAATLQREVPPGLFGENLTTQGVDVTGAVVGERWRVGADGLLLEVTGFREPCMTFQRRMAEPHWVRRFWERGWPGAYLRVVEPGTVAAGDAVTVVDRPGHGVTVGEVFLARTEGDPARLRWLLDTGEDLAPDLVSWVRQALRSGSVPPTSAG